MNQLHIIVDDNGRILKNSINALIRSGACENVLVQNYMHQYRAGEGKKLAKTQHKHIIINYTPEQQSKLITMLDKNLAGWKTHHWIIPVEFII